MIVNPLWAGPCVYAPMHVDALVIGTGNQGSEWAEVGMNYRQLTAGLNPLPGPFRNRLTPPATGIHLHWTLPFGLRSGAQRTGEATGVDFPLVPNRWLITRFALDADRPERGPQATAWVLQSDYLGTDGRNPFPSPLPGATGQITLLGKRFDLPAWAGAPGPATPFLTAPGPSDLGWAAIYDNVQDVLAFHDPVGETPGRYSYAAVGWHAIPADDPLHGGPGGFADRDAWKEIMSKLGWAIGSEGDMETRLRDAVEAFQLWLAANPLQGGPPATAAQLQLGSQTLCHGMIVGIPWRGSAPAYPVPDLLVGGHTPEIAIGSNSAECLASWIGNLLHRQNPATDARQVEDLLMAFQSDRLFDYLQDPSAFTVAQHALRFGTWPGGSVWHVERPHKAEEQRSPGLQELPLSPALADGLAELNERQEKLDRLSREITTLQWELLAARWKLEHLDPTDHDFLALRAQIQAYIARLTGTGEDSVAMLLARRASLRTEFQTSRASYEAALGLDYQLAEGSRLPFERTGDPVILLSGIGLDTKLDPPPPADGSTAEGPLFVRFTGQAVGGLQVSLEGIRPGLPPVSLRAADLQPGLAGLAAVALPKEAGDLWIENLLLDPGNSRWLAALAFRKAATAATPAELTSLAATIAKQQTLMWNPGAEFLDQRTVAEAAGLLPQFLGQPVNVPTKAAVAAWAPPWTPLYLDWEIEWRPSAATPQAMFGPWKFGEFDYEFAGSGMAPAAGRIQARSLLTSKYPGVLGAKLDAFLDTSPQLPMYQIEALRETARQIAGVDVMMQSLTGLIDQMIMRMVRPTLPPGDATIRQLTEGAPTWVPAAGPGDSTGFYPLRAGHFQINRLRIVDAYGQVLPGTPIGGAILPVRSRSLTPVDPNWRGFVELRPRLAQPARLDFRLICAENDLLPSHSADSSSPICGWLLPNHLDESLLVYDSAGRALGEILKVQYDRSAGLRWDPAPGRDDPLGSPPQLPNAHLRAMVLALLERGRANTQPLDDLLGLIDVTLWATDPLGPPRSGNLSVLVGRPIAVVRTALTFQLSGRPECNQLWRETGQRNTGAFERERLPVRVGDFALSNNGALGYFQDDDYRVCYAMYNYGRSLGDVRRRLLGGREADPRAAVRALAQPTGELAALTEDEAGGYISTGHVIPLACGGSETAMLTVLVDPRGVIPAISGVVPVVRLTLPNGPVDTALAAMEAAFRMGPLLIDPAHVHVPLPSAVPGKWSWIERTGVTIWREEGPLMPAGPGAVLPTSVSTLREGWLKLSGALPKNPP